MNGAIIKGKSYVRFFNPVTGGRIEWIDEEIIGFLCGCGCDEILVLSLDKDDPRECDNCGAKLYFAMKVEVKMA